MKLALPVVAGHIIILEMTTTGEHMTDKKKDKGAPLTPKMAAFVDFVVSGENLTQAYIKAYNWKGKSQDAVRQEASKLMKRPHVKARYEELKSNKASVKKSQRKLSKEWIITKLKEEADSSTNAASVRVRALEILAKTENLFSDSTTVTVQHRSSEEVEKELKKKLEDLFGKGHGDITLMK